MLKKCYRALIFTTCCLFLTAITYAQEPAAPIDKIVLDDGDSIVFLGDSITHQCLYTQYVEDFLYTRFPNKRFKIHNAGVGGARAWDALARFDEDVAAFKPKYVTILLGMNDGSYQPFNQEIFDTYRQDMATLLEKLDGIGARSILITPTMFDSRAARAGKRQRNPEMLRLYNSVLTYYGTWLREVAVDEGRGFVDMWGPLNNITLEQRKTDPKFTMIPDAVHPGPNGQVVMATAIVSDMGLPRQVSNIRIVGGTNKPVVRSSGGKVTELSWGESEVSFIWTANSLPWVLPEEAQLGVKLTRLGHRLSREALEVHGLVPGRYELSIDGEVVGTYQSTQLERHVELQGNSKTPQYQQALKVAELNKQRNEGPVRALRGEWSQFQRYARAKRAAEAAPDNAELAKQLATWKEKIDGMADRVAEKIAAAKQAEDQIFEVNKPRPRKYVLKKVE
jgi:lysophospholipase L1-like esterase